MSMSRREFLILTAGAGAIGGCQTPDESGASTTLALQRIVSAGPAAKYAADGVYDGFRNQGFFVVRQGEKLSAISSICTHKKCKLTAERDRSFYCPCHGSTFDPDGKVSTGPAKRDLPLFPSVVDEHGQLLVTVSGG